MMPKMIIIKYKKLKKKNRLEEDDINEESNKILDTKYIKDYHEYIFYKNRKILLDKNNIP